LLAPLNKYTTIFLYAPIASVILVLSELNSSKSDNVKPGNLAFNQALASFLLRVVLPTLVLEKPGSLVGPCSLNILSNNDSLSLGEFKIASGLAFKSVEVVLDNNFSTACTNSGLLPSALALWYIQPKEISLTSPSISTLHSFGYFLRIASNA